MKNLTKSFEIFRPILNIKRHQKNTQTKIFRKITLWQHALLDNIRNSCNVYLK